MPQPKTVSPNLAATRCTVCVLAYQLAGQLFTLGGQLLLRRWAGGSGLGAATPQWELVNWSLTLLTGTLAMLAPVLGAMLYFGYSPAALGLRRPKLQIRWAVPAYLFTAILFSPFVSALADQSGSGQSIVLPQSPAALMLSFLALCVMPPFCEELLFRGVCLRLALPLGAPAALAAQAVLFALLHGSLANALFALPAGLFLGWLALQTKSLLPGVALHFWNNLISFSLLLLQQQGYLEGLLPVLFIGTALLGLWAALALLRRPRTPIPPLRRSGSLALLLQCPGWYLTAAVLLLWDLNRFFAP